MPETIGILTLIASVFLIVLALLWCLVPFLILGANKRLDKANELTEAANMHAAKHNALLTEIRDNSAWLANEAIERQQAKDLNDALHHQ